MLNEVEKFVLATPKIQMLLDDKVIEKVIVVPKRLVNIVVSAT